MTALGISDHGNIGGHIEHWSECKKAKIKPILGCELYIPSQCAAIKSSDNRHNNHMVVWAKNKQGWYDLVKLVSRTNDPEYFYYKPRISLFNTEIEGKMHEGLESFLTGNIMGFSGHQGSILADSLFCDLFGDNKKRSEDIKKAYGQYKNKDIEFYKQFLKPNWLESTSELALKLQKMFGKDNFFIELQDELNPNDKLALWIHPLIVSCLRQVSKATGIPAMTSSDPHYANPEDADDQRIMVSVNMKETEESIQRKLSDDQESDIMVFFGSNNFYIHSYDEIKDKFTQEELEMTNKVAAMVEEYDISAKPSIPKFDIPNLPDLPFLRKIENPSDKYLMYLCVEGAKKFEPWTKSDKYKREDYWNRLNEEFKVIIEAGLSDYFLIVWDFCMAADNRPADHSFDWRKNLELGGKTDPIPRGVGRGSAAGCLISYLVSITGIDPILYNLIFSRFYNKGRNTADHIELPDIDSDFAVEDREWIIKYIENKYGQENVAQIITFQRMQGRAAIKDVFRVKGIKGGFELSNEICKYIPNEAEVADELQEIRDSGHPDYGLIKYSIDNSDEIQKFIKDEKIKGVLDQAIRCEGVKRGQGRHPSGIIVTPKPVKDHFPMVYDTRSKQKIIGVDMNNAAKLGGVKIDLLGTAILDKLKMTQDLVNKVKPRRNRVDHYQEEIE